MFRALLSGFNIQNVSITGENQGFSPGSFATFDDVASTKNNMAPDNDDSLSVIDGVGWKWWCWYEYVEILNLRVVLSKWQRLTLDQYTLVSIVSKVLFLIIHFTFRSTHSYTHPDFFGHANF